MCLRYVNKTIVGLINCCQKDKKIKLNQNPSKSHYYMTGGVAYEAKKYINVTLTY